MIATEKLRQLLDERGVEWMPCAWEPQYETFYKNGDGVGFIVMESRVEDGVLLRSDRVSTPEQAIEATLGRGTCRFVWSLADNGWADHTCSECGYVENTDVHVHLGWQYCPNCGREVRA